MVNKGLCSTCMNDSGCTFTRKLPVIHCEEFEAEETRPSAKVPQRKKIRSTAEETVCE